MSRMHAALMRSRGDAVVRRTMAELNIFTDWLAANNALGSVGEFGVHWAGADADAWREVVARYYAALDAANLWSAQWACARTGTHQHDLFLNSGPATGLDTVTPLGDLASLHPDGIHGRRGVNLSGWEYNVSSNRVIGASIVATLADFRYIAAHKITHVRLHIAWEKVQRDLGAVLDGGALAELHGQLVAARTAGVDVILALRDQARYRDASSGSLVTKVMSTDAGAGGLTETHLADVWTKMSTWVRADVTRSAAVLGYDLMNEPHDLAAEGAVGGAQVWEHIAQVALSAIRAAGDTRLVMVPGYGASHPHQWVTYHPAPFITDGAKNFRYTAHQYFDAHNGYSGSYALTYAQECADAVAQGY